MSNSTGGPDREEAICVATANRRELMAGTVGTAALASLALPGSAAADGGDRILGSFAGPVTVEEPPGIPGFIAQFTFSPGGGVVESARLYLPGTPFGDWLETPGNGAWERTGSRTYAVGFQLVIQKAPGDPDAGAFVGIDRVWWTATLERGGGRLAGPFFNEIRDPSGALLFGVRGRIEADRLAARPPG
jgi:hypothetical protein